MVSPPVGVFQPAAGVGLLVASPLGSPPAAVAAPPADETDVEAAVFVLPASVVWFPAPDRDLEADGREANSFFPSSRSLASVVGSTANIRTMAARVHVRAVMPR